MSLDPRVFRNMQPGQIALALAIEHGIEQQQKAKSLGAACSDCMDTGLANGRFCGCEAGQKLNGQARR